MTFLDQKAPSTPRDWILMIGDEPIREAQAQIDPLSNKKYKRKFREIFLTKKKKIAIFY